MQTGADTEEEVHRLSFDRAFSELGQPCRWDEALYVDILH